MALKGLAIFLLLTVILGAIPADSLGRVSIYNHLVPGRPRLPFGETPQRSYNLSLYNLEAMFASHEIAKEKPAEEYRVILLGDSSVWGTLLKPEETLAGRLNALQMQLCGKSARFYNLGYPTISLAKDVLILQRALQEKPDLAIWVTTLEAFPVDKQYASPLAENNRSRLQPVLGGNGTTGSSGLLDYTLFNRRREYADWARLQLYGIPWATSAIDQDYPKHYPPAAIDLEADDTFHDLKPGDDLLLSMAWNVLEKGIDLADTSKLPIVLVNEPILVSNGQNSETRYNFYYPRWAYDTYRTELTERANNRGWKLFDSWDSIAMDQFTNSAIHLTPQGEVILAELVSHFLSMLTCQ